MYTFLISYFYQNKNGSTGYGRCLFETESSEFGVQQLAEAEQQIRLSEISPVIINVVALPIKGIKSLDKK